MCNRPELLEEGQRVMGHVSYVKVACWNMERHEAIVAFTDGIIAGPAGVISNLFAAAVISGKP